MKPVYDVVINGKTVSTHASEIDARNAARTLEHYEIWKYTPSQNVVVVKE